MLKIIKNSRFHVWIPSWMFIGVALVLIPIFAFVIIRSVTVEQEHYRRIMLEKGVAAIRSFETGARVGLRGLGEKMKKRHLLMLLSEMTGEADLAYMAVTDSKGIVVAHSDPSKIGRPHISPDELSGYRFLRRPHWRETVDENGKKRFEVFRFLAPHCAFERFCPPGGRLRGMHGMMRRGSHGKFREIIFAGFDGSPLAVAKSDATRKAVIMGIILLFLGLGGVISLFIAQGYRNTKASLSRVKAFSDTLVKNMPTGLIATDGRERIASVNQTAEAILAFDEKSVVGKKARTVLPDALWKTVTELNDGKSRAEREIKCPTRDGLEIPMEVSTAPLRDRAGFLGHVILFKDVSEVHELRKEVLRTQKLAATGKLAAGVAHEIRNPLSSIKGFATYFKERYKNEPEDGEIADVMIEEIDRLNRVVSDLLEFSGPVKLVKARASVPAILDNTLKLVGNRIKERSIAVRRDFAADMKAIPLDADGISRVVLNLFLNAIDAMEEGGTLTAGCGRDRALKVVRITVADTGCGIDANALPRIFDPYFTGKPAGSGIGLANVHSIVKAHAGRIEVESTEGAGSTFTITLPDESADT